MSCLYISNRCSPQKVPNGFVESSCSINKNVDYSANKLFSFDVIDVTHEGLRNRVGYPKITDSKWSIMLKSAIKIGCILHFCAN